MKQNINSISPTRFLAATLVAASTAFVIGCSEPPVKPVPITQPWSDMSLPIGDAIVWGSNSSEVKILHQGALHEIADKYVNYFENDGWTTTNRDSSEHTYTYGFKKGGEQFEVHIYTFEDVGVIIKRKSQSNQLAFANGKPAPRSGANLDANGRKQAAPQIARMPSPSSGLGANETYLRNLKPTSVETLSGNDHKMDRRFEVQKVAFENGIYVHPPGTNTIGRATYDLSGAYVRLTGRVGVGDHNFRRAWSPLTFRIVGDGKELWKSRPVQQCGDWVAFDVELANINELVLEVICKGDHTGAHGAWMDPVLTLKR